MHKIEFKEISNNNFKNLFVHDVGIKKRPKERVIIHDNIQGRNGVLIEHTGVYEAYDRNIQIWDKDGVHYLENWLSGYGKLRLSTEPHGYYKAHCIDDIEIIATEAGVGKLYNVNFLVQPFFFLDVGDSFIYIKSNETLRLNNSYKLKARPLIEVIGNGDLEFWFNEEKIKLNDVYNKCIIDSEIMETYDNERYKAIKMYGEYPILSAGINTIKPINCDIKIKPRWCRL